MAAEHVSNYKEFLIILGVAGLVVPLFLRIGVNAILAFLLVGILLSPDVLGRLVYDIPLLNALVITDSENLSAVAELGVVFLLFLIGLELSFERLNTMRRLVFGLGGLQVFLSLLIIAGSAALILGFDTRAALIAGAALSLSSTAIVVQLLSDSKRLGSQTGRTSFAILLFQDLAVIPLLLLVSILGQQAEANLVLSIAKALLQAHPRHHTHRRRWPLPVAPLAPLGGRHQQCRSVHGGNAADRGRNRRGRQHGRPLHGAGRLHRRTDARRNGIPPRHRSHHRAVQGLAARHLLPGCRAEA
jgi:hypothetical protein